MNKNLREEKLSQILESFPGDCSELTDDQFYLLWVDVSKIPGWSGVIWREKLLPENILLKLEVLDDKIIAVTNSENNHYYQVLSKNRKKLVDFIQKVKETDPDFVKNGRLEYLENEIERLEKRSARTFKLFKENGFSFLGDVILKVFDYSEDKKRIKRFQYEYRSLKFNKKPSQSIPEEEIEMAKNADCSQFVDVERKVGGKSWCLCPFHKEGTPSFCCYEEGKGFFCYGCGAGGDAITLVRKLHGLNFRDAVNLINNK